MLADFYFDKAGQPTSFEAWVEQFEAADDRRVGSTVVGHGPGKKWVSTVWLGLDHNFDREGPPLIFESMVFHRGGGHRLSELDCRRYATEAEAQQGHVELVEKYRYTRKQRRAGGRPC